MRHLELQEFTANLPEGFRDQSVNIFTVAQDGINRLSLVIAREDPEPDDTLETYAKRTLDGLEKALPEFKVIEQQMTEVNRVDAFVFDARLGSTQGPLFQRQGLLFVEQRALSITASGSAAHADAVRDQFWKFVSSMRFRVRET
jgi:hypothetical protein